MNDITNNYNKNLVEKSRSVHIPQVAMRHRIPFNAQGHAGDLEGQKQKRSSNKNDESNAAYGGILKRSKRNSDKKKRCKDMKRDSIGFRTLADILSIQFSAAAGSGARVDLSGVTAVDYYEKRGNLGISYVEEDCDDIPFNEIKEIFDQRFSSIDRKFREISLDENFILFKEVSKTAVKTLSTLEETRVEIHQGFEDVLKSIKDLEIKLAVIPLEKFIRYFESEQERIKLLPKNEYINKLQKTNILLNFRELKTPAGDSLHGSLDTIITQKYATQKEANDETKLIALDSLCYGTLTYVSVMLFLLKQYSFLADYHYQDGDVDKYNEYFDLMNASFKDFKFSLTDSTSSKPLIDNVIDLLRKVRGEDFVQNKDGLSKHLSKRIESLTKIKTQLQEMMLPIIVDTPEKLIVKPQFSHVIRTPIGDWKDEVMVSYAVQYTSNGTYSKVGPWSKSYKVRGKACPTFQLPSESENRTRLIFRRFNDNIPQLIGVVEDQYQRKFRDIDRDLYNAALNFNADIAIDEARILMDNGADVNAVFDNGRRAIHAAAEGGNHDLASSFLINNSTDINVKDNKGYTSMHIAAEAGHKEFIELLMGHGADVNAKTYSDQFTPLHLATRKGHLSAIEALIKSNTIDVNLGDKDGFTPLHGAVFKGSLVTQTLISNNDTNVNSKSNSELTPLHFLSINDHSDTAEALLKSNRLDLNSRAKGNLTSLHLASMFGSLEMVKFLTAQNKTDVNAKSGGLLEKEAAIEDQTKDGFTALHFAVMLGHLQVVSTLVDNGANLRAKTPGGSTPLHLALKSRNLDLVKYFQGKGADFSVKDDNGFAPLLFAAKHGHLDVVKYLMEEIDVDPKVMCNLPARPLAAYYGHLDIVKYLSTKEKRNLVAFNNYVSLASAALNGHLEIVTYLAGERFDLVRNEDDTYILERLYKIISEKHNIIANNTDLSLIHRLYYIPHYFMFGLGVNCSFQGFIILLSAANGHLAVAKYFINNKQHPEVDSYKRTLLHYVAAYGSLELVRYLTEEKHDDISAEDQDNMTPLLYAVINDQFDVIEYLVGKGANCNPNKMWSPLILAAATGNLDMANYFVARGADVNARCLGGSINKMIISPTLIKYITSVEGCYTCHYYHQTPLCMAASNGHFDMVRYLTEKGADVDTTCSLEGDSPSYAAAKNGHVDIFKYLVDGKRADFDIQGYERMLYSAAGGGHLGMVRHIVEKGAALGSSISYRAVESGNLELVKYLVEKGASLYDGVLFTAAQNGRLNIVKYLVDEQQFSVNIVNVFRETPSYYAVRNGHLDVVKYLIGEKHADPDFGATSLCDELILEHVNVVAYVIEKIPNCARSLIYINKFLLAVVESGDLNTVKYFVEKGANINAVAGSSITPLYMADLRCDTEIAHFLKSRGARRNRRSIEVEHLPRKVHSDDDFYRANDYIVANETSKPSWTNVLARTVVSAVKGVSQFISAPLWPTVDTKHSEPSNAKTIRNTDVNGTLLLLDVFIRKITRRKYVSTEEQSVHVLNARGGALSITAEFEKILKDTAKRVGVSARFSFDPVTMLGTIECKLISGELFHIPSVLYSAVEEAYSKNGTFMNILKSSVEKMLYEESMALNRDSKNQKGSIALPLPSLSSIVTESINSRKGITYV